MTKQLAACRTLLRSICFIEHPSTWCAAVPLLCPERVAPAPFFFNVTSISEVVIDKK